MSVTLSPDVHTADRERAAPPAREPAWQTATRALLAAAPAALDRDDVQALLPLLSPQRLREDQPLQPDGTSEAVGLWLLLEGRLGVARADDRSRLVAVLLPGDLACVLPGHLECAAAPGGTAVRALSPALLAAFPPAARLAGAGRPGLVARLLAVLAARGRAEARLRAAQQHAALPARLAQSLLDLADRCGVPGPEGLLVDHGLTQEQLGELIGACRESVNKALGDLGRGDALHVLPRSVVLRRPDVLRAHAHADHAPRTAQRVQPQRVQRQRLQPQRIQEVNHIRSRHAVTGRVSAVSTGSR